MPVWNQSHYSRDPTVDGLKEALAIIPPPELLANINGIQERWKVAVLALLVHQLHNDGDHINLTHGFHSLTSTHYCTGSSRPGPTQQTNQQQRMTLWQMRTDHTKTILALIFDLCTALDRLTGGSTLFFHHPGATVPGGDITPESLKADVYVNPRVLAENEELHQIVAELSQFFIEHFATPLAHRFATCHTLNNWPASSGSSTTPSHSSTANYNRVPLVPAPLINSSCHFHVRGRPSSSLAQLIGLNTTLLSVVPQGSPLTWNTKAVPIFLAPADPNTSNIQAIDLRKSTKRPVVVYESEDEDDGYPDTSPITPIRNKSAVIPSAMKVSKQRALQLPSPQAVQPSSSLQRTIPLLRVQHEVLRSFGPETEEVIDTLGLPDTLHTICANIEKASLPKRWVAKLMEEAGLSMEQAEAISEAMLQDAGFFSCNSAQVGRTKMSDIIKDKAEYDELTEDEKKALVAEFDEFKSHAAKHPPNITACTKSTECAKSFQALEALSQCAGIEAFVFMVCSTSDFQMTPKAFFTSAACEHFMRIYLRRDAARTATDFKSAMLSKGIFTSAATNHKNRVIEAKRNIRAGLRASLCEVTKDASATVEFTRYEVAIVRKYHIKLVGWNHPQWANPSDLKGGIEALENVVAAIANNTCRFVEITADEVEEHRQKIADGAVLTPETKPRLPPPPTSTLILSPPSQPTPLLSAEPCLPPPPTTLISSPPSQPTPVSSAEPHLPPPPTTLISSPPSQPTPLSSALGDFGDSISASSASSASDFLIDTHNSFDTLPDVSQSESRPSLPISSITDDLVDPSLLALSRDTQNTAYNDSAPPTTSQLPLHRNKRLSDAVAPQPHTKHVRKLTEKQAALEDARIDSEWQRKSKKKGT
ncbi:uncharacterized protein HD556DRAFT_1440600 [Suillus plorans]|uniref:Uncharacterized protein n=1 Tax=Suillus plorans TaxID=116603 RepID=A0A9P7DM52_9AGAM|nr:uncharacterized protein HD556DRAFT_1440600 [Suillus plorans]KAG1798263.1 hypothetical protein HD556DRAFT_1440600 [Suillus plorans]